jgi:aspartate aminotransferase
MMPIQSHERRLLSMFHPSKETVEAPQSAGSSSPLRVVAGARRLTPSPTLSLNERMGQQPSAGKPILDLGFGEASFPLHPLLKEALREAPARTQYAPVLGLPALRAAIAEYVVKTRGVSASAEYAMVAPGSKALLYALLQVLEGDLLLPIPSWVSYAPQARLAGKRIIPVATDPADPCRLTPEQLTEALTRGQQEGATPGLLLINSPNNPTGGMLDGGDMEAVAVWARAAQVTLISDEIYAELAHGWREHVSPARFYPEGTLITGGLSKAFSAGGWRLGYVAIPQSAEGSQLLAALSALASEIWSAAATPIQEAAVVAFTPNPDISSYVQSSARLHAAVTTRIYQTLRALGILCPRPAGAFYLYPDFAPWRACLLARGVRTSQELASYLSDTWGIATLPGTAFGEPPEALRLRLVTSRLYRAKGTSAEEQEELLWHLLERASTEALSGQENWLTSSLPLIGETEARLAALVESLGAPGS